MNNRIPNDIWLRVVGISLLIGLSILVGNVFRQPQTGRIVALISLNVASIILTWHLNRAIIIYFRAAFLPRAKIFKRLVISLLTCMLATTLLAWLFDVFRDWAVYGTLANFPYGQGSFQLVLGNVTLDMNAYSLDVFHAFFIAIFFLVIYELLFYRQDSSLFRQQLEKSEQEREKLRIANLQSQLDVLKQQVNPHFLFNSLNSLSSLISEDPKQAERFVDKLSGVYRYVLRANEEHLTTLDTELQFIDSYYHLLQTRYGTGLSLTIAVEASHRTCQLPPLTLQLLVENAVKHNVVSPRRPLSIRIEVDDENRLVVQNTLQRKATRAFSNGVGLSNIVAKYQMLNLAQPVVEESPDQFTVRLPLLVCE
jgi:two-component system LytT family sensor kinase